MTISELIFDCLKLGLDGEKADYEVEAEDDRSLLLKFDDGDRVRVSVELLK